MPAFLALALLCLAAPLIGAQETFVDEDFAFSFDVPPGMAQVSDADLKAARGMPPDAPFNVPAADTPDGKTMHMWVWADEEARGREVRLVLHDYPLPFTKQEEFADATLNLMKSQGSVDIIDQTALQPPEYKGGLLLEVRITQEDGKEFGNLSAYFIMGAERYGLLSFRAYRENWAAEKDKIMEAFRTVEFTGAAAGQGQPPPGGMNRPSAPGGPRAGGARPGGPGGRPGAQGQPAAASESWSTLEVAGSIVLALLLLMGLFMGGRSA
jgi:hypothetical protein